MAAERELGVVLPGQRHLRSCHTSFWSDLYSCWSSFRCCVGWRKEARL